MPVLDGKQTAVDIFLQTLAAIDVEHLFEQRIRLEGDTLVFDDGQRVDLRPYSRIYVVGIGKASLKMGRAIEHLLGHRLTKGILVAPDERLPVKPGFRSLRETGDKSGGLSTEGTTQPPFSASSRRSWRLLRNLASSLRSLRVPLRLGGEGLLQPVSSGYRLANRAWLLRGPEMQVKSEVIVASHPTPDTRSLIAGRKVIELVSQAGAGSLIIFLISGGGSSLLESPLVPAVTADDLAELNRVLVTSSAPIHEINVVRKHLSLVKGGRLGALAGQAACLAIYVSDVNGGDLQSIASNPVLPDSATLEEFYGIVTRHNLIDRFPPKYAAIIKERRVPPLPHDDRPVTTFLLSDNRGAVTAAARIASSLGFTTKIFDGLEEGYYKDIASNMIDRFTGLEKQKPGQPLCAVSGGEVICPVHGSPGSGLGGRNQEFVLYSAAKLADGFRSTVVLSCGTDGIDGNSVAAGAVADGNTIGDASSIGLDYLRFLENNDSFSFFRRAGGLVVTGPTGNNVRDIRLMLCNADRLA